MTVAELIAELRKYPADLQVYISGYEGGVDDVTDLVPVRVQRDVNTESYYGRHEDLYDDQPGGTPGLRLR